MLKDDLQIPKQERLYSDKELKDFHDLLSRKYRIYGLNKDKELCSFVSERLWLEKERNALLNGAIVGSEYEFANSQIQQYKNWQYRCGAYTESLRIDCSEAFKKKYPDWKNILKSGPHWDSEKGGLIKVNLTSL